MRCAQRLTGFAHSRKPGKNSGAKRAGRQRTYMSLELAAGTRAASARRSPREGGARPALPWTRLSDEELLSMRFCDLQLSIDQSPLKRQVTRLYAELEGRGIQLRPHVWLSEEWFSPDGVPGIAVPFYLAHPRLEQLERHIMREVEGGNTRWFMRILRHEAGEKSSDRPPCSIRIATRRVPAAAAMYIISANGTHRPILPKISPKPSPCG
jgi:hypothetical protein